MSQITCSNVRCTSCTRAVDVRRHVDVNRRRASRPRRRPCRSARSSAGPARAPPRAPATTLGDAPLVLMPSATSPGRPSASICRANTRSYAVVVADARQHARIGGQRDRRQRRALALKSSDELGRDVLRVRGAAAVAEQQQLAPVRQRVDDGRRRVEHRGIRVRSRARAARSSPPNVDGSGPQIARSSSRVSRSFMTLARNSSSVTCSGSLARGVIRICTG